MTAPKATTSVSAMSRVTTDRGKAPVQLVVPTVTQERVEPASEPQVTSPEQSNTSASNQEDEYVDPVQLVKNLIAAFDEGELTEVEIARKAPESYGHHVLVEVYATAQNIDALDTWMGTQAGIPTRYKSAESGSPHIYAYVKVSLLGTLSGRSDVDEVRVVEYWSERHTTPEGVTGQGGKPTPPRLPPTGDYPYPKLRGRIANAVVRYYMGDLTATEAAALNDYHRGESVAISILFMDESRMPEVTKWLVARKVPESTLDIHLGSIFGYVPISIIGELSRQPGILEITSARSSGYRSGGPEGAIPPPATATKPPKATENQSYRPAPARQNQQAPAPTPTPTPHPTITSQGVAVHGADDWHASHDGSGVKIGIIDTGFKEYKIIEAYVGELPAEADVTVRCYESGTNFVPTSDLDDCDDGDTHGTGVVETLYDMVDGATYYLSNAARLSNSTRAATRLKEDVKRSGPAFWPT